MLPDKKHSVPRALRFEGFRSRNIVSSKRIWKGMQQKQATTLGSSYCDSVQGSVGQLFSAPQS